MSKKNEKRKLMICMAAVYMFFVMGIWDSVPLHTSTDELGTIAGAAFLAGNDWSDVIEYSGYYGFGYYSLFFFLFKLVDSPIIIYRVIIVATVFLRVLIIPIAYYIGKQYLKIESELVLFLTALLMPFLYSQKVGVIFNEYVLELLVWISILLICKLIENYEDKKKYLTYLGLLSMILFYSLFIHTRALTLVIAMTLVVSIYELTKKEWMKALCFAGINILLYYLSQMIISVYQKNLFGSAGNEVRNGAVSISSKADLLDYKTWDIWFHMLMSLLDTEVILTGGLLGICIVTFFFYIYRVVVQKENNDKYCNAIFSVTVLCMGATIAAFLLSSWFEGMMNSWKTANMGNDYSYKGLTYVRYWNIYMPPFILCAISRMSDRKIVDIAGLGIVILHIFFAGEIIPIIQNNNSAASFFYGLAGYSSKSTIIDNRYYYLCILYSMFIFLIVYIISKTRYRYWVLPIFLVFFMIQHSNEMYLYDNEVKDKMSSKITASYNEKCRLEQDGVEIDEIYIYDVSKGTDANWKLYSIAQFYFHQYTIHDELPEKINFNDIIISTEKSELISEKYNDISCYILDDNEIWYTYLELKQ